MRVKYPFRDLPVAFDASGIWRSEGVPHLSCALGLVGVKVYRSGGNQFKPDAYLDQVVIETPPLWHTNAVASGGVHPITYVGFIAFPAGFISLLRPLPVVAGLQGD